MNWKFPAFASRRKGTSWLEFGVQCLESLLFAFLAHSTRDAKDQQYLSIPYNFITFFAWDRSLFHARMLMSSLSRICQQKFFSSSLEEHLVVWLLYCFSERNNLSRITKFISLLIMITVHCPLYLCIIVAIDLFFSFENLIFQRYAFTSFEVYTAAHIYGYLLQNFITPTSVSVSSVSDEAFFVSIFGFFHTINVALLLMILLFLQPYYPNTRLPFFSIFSSQAVVAYIYFIAFPHFDSFLHQSLISWLLGFIYKPLRLYILFYWAALLVISLPAIGSVARSNSLPLIIIRKLFHALACLLFAPVIYLDLDFMRLSFSISCSLLLFIEILRNLFLSLFKNIINNYFDLFIDSEKSSKLSMNHFYLLFGCGVPCFIQYYRLQGGAAFLPFVGLLSIGVGDSFVNFYHLSIKRTVC